MRFSEHRSRHQNTALVGHGLTAAAQGESPTVGSGAETGERVAKLAPLHRTAGGSCNATGEKSVHVKADQDGLGLPARGE